jgi:hypothetical protein
LAVKRSKCSFGQSTVTYLGHVISKHDITMDAEKVAVVQQWLLPRTMCVIHGFLGLTSYYRKFIRSYGEITGPLTKLLKQEAFCWSSETAVAFESLKAALTAAPVLQLCDFAQPFVVNCDASGLSIITMLHQGQGPITFFSRAMAPHHAKLPMYKRELISMVKAIRHWRPYLWPHEFIVRTDHFSLKYLLDERLSMIPQHN